MWSPLAQPRSHSPAGGASLDGTESVGLQLVKYGVGAQGVGTSWLRPFLTPHSPLLTSSQSPPVCSHLLAISQRKVLWPGLAAADPRLSRLPRPPQLSSAACPPLRMWGWTDAPRAWRRHGGSVSATTANEHAAPSALAESPRAERVPTLDLTRSEPK